jgi:hypothetical protein
LQQILDNAVLLQIGQKVIAIIRARTLRGDFLPGSTSKGYSTRDASMPWGALEERIGKGNASKVFRDIKSAGKDGNGDRIFLTSKRMWVTLKGGYKRMREITGRETDRVTLNWTGHMMRSLATKADPSTSSVTIYFTDAEAERIASYHYQGAGRNKIKRLFMGLADKEKSDIEKWLGEEILKKFKLNIPSPKQ